MASPELDLPTSPNSTSLITLGVAFVFAVVGQLALLEANMPVGLGLYGTAIVIFIFAVRGLESGVPAPRLFSTPDALSPRFGLWVTSLALTWLIVDGALQPLLSATYDRLIVAGWLINILIFSLSVSYAQGWGRPQSAALLNWWRAHWRETLIIIGVGGLALALRLYDLELFPYPFVNDEGEIGKEAWGIWRGETTRFFSTGWAGQPMWSFVPTAFSIGVLGNTALAVRLVSALQGTLTVVLVYAFGRDVFDQPTGLLAAGVLAALPLHLHFSRLGFNNVADGFTSTLLLWLTFRAVRRGRLSSYLWAGLCTGLALYTYLGSRLAMLLVLGVLGYMALTQRGYVRAHWRPLLVFAGALIIVAAPMAVWFWKNPNIFMGRINMEGILNNGWLEREAVEKGRGYLAVLLGQFQRTTLAFVAQGAPSGFFNSPRPYLTVPAAIFGMLGLGYSFWRWREPRHLTLLAWFWSVVILGGTFTLGPPASQRLLMTTPVLALWVALGLRQTARVLEHTGFVPPRAAQALSVIALVIIGAQNVWFYFVDYRNGNYFTHPTNEITYEMKQHIGPLGPDYRIYLLGEPSAYAVFANFRFFAPETETLDFNTVTPQSLAALPRDKGAFFLAVPERLADLEQVAQWFPGGQWIEAPSRLQASEMLYYAYQLTPEQFAEP